MVGYCLKLGMVLAKDGVALPDSSLKEKPSGDGDGGKMDPMLVGSLKRTWMIREAHMFLL